MLEMLDVVIGLSVVMLFLSMAVTLITQLVVDTLNSRGSFLRGGIAELLHLIDAGIDAKTAKTIADFILRDEMIAGRVPGMSQRRLASAVHREELTKLILGFSEDLRGPLAVVQKAAPHELKVEGWVLGFFAGLARLLAAVTRRFSKDLTPSNQAAPDGRPVAGKTAAKLTIISAAQKKRLDEITAAQAKMKISLRDNGVGDPKASLSDIRMTALLLEKSNPELSNAARTNTAILHHLETEFVAKLNGWFDQTIDRVTDRFTSWTRAITVVGAIVVAFGLQVDSLALINRLSTDDAARNALVEYALENKEENLKPKAGDTAKTMLDRLNKAAGTDLIPLPDLSYKLAPIKDWACIVVGVPGQILKALTVDEWPGILLTAVLLSLGAPFWYNALKNLVGLRSMVAGKDDDQRKERQDTQTAAPGAAAAGVPAIAAGERGDLGAVG